MGEEPPKGPTIDVSAAKLVAFIGTIVMIFEGIAYLRYAALVSPVLYTITGIVCIACAVVLLLLLEVGIKISTPIPYKWWLLLAISGGVMVLAFIIQNIISGGTIFGTPWYLGGLLVGIAGLLELLIEGGKLSWAASKFVLLIGAAIVIVLSVQPIIVFAATNGAQGTIIPLVTVSLGVILILMVFDVVPKVFPKEWWLILICGIGSVLILSTVLIDFPVTYAIPVFSSGGSVILVGFILHILDY